MTVCGWICIAAIAVMVASVVWSVRNRFEYLEDSPAFGVTCLAFSVFLSFLIIEFFLDMCLKWLTQTTVQTESSVITLT